MEVGARLAGYRGFLRHRSSGDFFFHVHTRGQERGDDGSDEEAGFHEVALGVWFCLVWCVGLGETAGLSFVILLLVTVAIVVLVLLGLRAFALRFGVGLSLVRLGIRAVVLWLGGLGAWAGLVRDGWL